MAQGRRVERVAALIRREMGDLLANGLRDERIGQGMVSVTHVDVAGDLQHCKVLVSIFGSDADQRLVMAGLLSATPWLRASPRRRMRPRADSLATITGGRP